MKPNQPSQKPSANKRSESQKKADLLLIERLSLEGWSTYQIAAHFRKVRPYSLSQGQVFQDLKKIQARWMEALDTDIQVYVAKELKKLDKQERELWKAWRRSCKDAESETITQGESGTYTQTKREGQAGGVQFQNAIATIGEQRRALLGLDKPKKTAITDAEGKESYQPLVIAVTPEELPTPKKK